MLQHPEIRTTSANPNPMYAMASKDQLIASPSDGMNKSIDGTAKNPPFALLPKCSLIWLIKLFAGRRPLFPINCLFWFNATENATPDKKKIENQYKIHAMILLRILKQLPSKLLVHKAAFTQVPLELFPYRTDWIQSCLHYSALQMPLFSFSITLQFRTSFPHLSPVSGKKGLQLHLSYLMQLKD